MLKVLIAVAVSGALAHANAAVVPYAVKSDGQGLQAGQPVQVNASIKVKDLTAATQSAAKPVIVAGFHFHKP